MGCFDTVMVPCPICGAHSEFQSKGGDCLLRTYNLEDAPADVLSDVNRHAPNQCEKCGIWFQVVVDVDTKVCDKCGAAKEKPRAKSVESGALRSTQ